MIGVNNEFNQEEIDRVIEIYDEKGIVTRNECLSIDSRTFGRHLQCRFEDLGYETALYTEIHTVNWRDYSGVLFDTNRITLKEVEKYMFEKVLNVE